MAALRASEKCSQPAAVAALFHRRAARPQGEHFSVSLRMFYAKVLVTNRTGWKSRSRLLVFAIILVSLCLTGLGAPRAADQKAVYVGTDACKGGHEAQVDPFITSSKKAKS